MRDKRLFTVKEISRMYKVRLQTLYWWIRNKKFSYIKINKLIFIRESNFVEFLDQHTVGD